MTTASALPASAPSAANVHLMQLTSACWTSRCLHVVAELGIADLIGDQPQSTDALAKGSGTQPQALYRVMRLLASLGIFEWNDGAWRHTEASRFLRSDHPGSLRDYVRMMGVPEFWNAFGDLDYSLRTGKSAFVKQHPEGAFGYLAAHPEVSRLFDSAMTSKAHRDIAAIVPAYDFSQFATIADVAGGRGHLLRAILKSSPKTQGILFDQPHVIAGVTAEKGERLATVAGNFFADAMPHADAYLLMNIIHDWPDAESVKILSGIRRAMPSHARVLIFESVVPPTPGPHLSKELDIVMMTIPGGMERTQQEYAELAARSGLRLDHIVPTMSAFSILEFSAA
ncbi:MAG: methyltransferase [Candidatus Acidiferrales bacterium]